MKRLFKKIVEFVKGLFGKKSTDQQQVSWSTDEGEPIADVKVEKETPVLVSKVESSNSEPEVTDPESSVQSFLWKPEGDHTALPVVVVAADKIKSQDLYMEVLGKSNKVLKVDIKNTGRANGLPGFKFARVHFRLNRSGKDLQKSAPLKVRFFVMKGKKKHPVKVLGKTHIVIQKATSRKDLK